MVISFGASAGAGASSSGHGHGHEGHVHVQSAVDASIVAMTNHALTRTLRDDPTTGNLSLSQNLIITLILPRPHYYYKPITSSSFPIHNWTTSLPQPYPTLSYQPMLTVLIVTHLPSAAAIYTFGSALAESSSSSSSSSSGVGGSGFRNVMELAGLDTLQTTLESTDWKVVTDAELPGLERRIQEMLKAIESYEVPDLDEGGGSTSSKPKSNTSSSSKDKRKAQRGNSKNTTATADNAVSMRLLADDFMTLPLDSIPNYASLVPRMLSIETMQETLHNHEYRSMSAVSKDFYTLLNNGCTVTPMGSSTWRDAQELAKLFERVKAASLVNHAGGTGGSGGSGGTKKSSHSSAAAAAATIEPVVGTGGTLIVVRTGANTGNQASSSSSSSSKGSSSSSSSSSSSAGKATTITCSCCQSVYHVTGWPTGASIGDVSSSTTTTTGTTATTTAAAGTWSLVSGAKITLSAADRRLDCIWALKQMQSDGNFQYSLPSDYIPEHRER